MTLSIINSRLNISSRTFWFIKNKKKKDNKGEPQPNEEDPKDGKEGEEANAEKLKAKELEKQKGKSSLSLGTLNKDVLKLYTQFNDFYDVILNPAESEIPHLYQVG